MMQFQQPTFLNSDNPFVLEDNILFLIMIGKKNFHTYILSDQEANRCRVSFKNMIIKYPECHEAYFGLAKIYFHLNKLDLAIECINKALTFRDTDHTYYLWRGLILYYIVSYNNSNV
jgi:tetratricopeptide (TPR) repeat protein